MSQYMELREKWPEFIYEGYYIEETEDEIKVRYRFRIPGLSDFAPEWRFPKDVSRYHRHASRGCILSDSALQDIRADEQAAHAAGFREDPVFQRMIFSLGMVELISYWKICCPPTVWVEAGSLDQGQIAWWKELYYNGLGEFFYTNRIQEADLDTFMDIRCRAPKRTVTESAAWKH